MAKLKLAGRLSEVVASVTLAIDAKAKALKSQGADLCNFTVGEPDFETPSHIREAAKKALDEGKTKYGPASGDPALKAAVAAKLKNENGLDYSSDNIIITNGGKQSLFNCILAMIEKDDEVIIPAPYWLSYPEMVRMAGGRPVVLPTLAAARFKITAQQLRAAISPKTKILILNSPSNPTGMVYSKKELQEIATVVVEKDIWVLSDEIYEKLIYEGRQFSIGSLGSEIFSHTIISNGFAKAFSMTGWRVGYLAGPAELIKATTKIQSHSTSNVCTFAQAGALAALSGSQDPIEKMRSAFRERRDLACQLFDRVPLLSYQKPDGAFYLFVDISKTGLKSLEFCERLLEEQKVALVPGIAFGDDNHVRISYATDLSTIKKGVERIGKFIDNLR